MLIWHISVWITKFQGWVDKVMKTLLKVKTSWVHRLNPEGQINRKPQDRMQQYCFVHLTYRKPHQTVLLKNVKTAPPYKITYKQYKTRQVQNRFLKTPHTYLPYSAITLLKYQAAETLSTLYYYLYEKYTSKYYSFKSLFKSPAIRSPPHQLIQN